jgi:hypothetical protein
VKHAGFDSEAIRRCWIILGAVTLVQGATILIFRNVFVPPVLAHAARVGLLGWALSALAALTYVAYSVRGLQLGTYIRRFPTFRILGPIMAIPTSILEEVFFRQYLMDRLAHAGAAALLQILLSAAIFGITHAFWGFRGGARAVLNAVGSTTFLGVLLGIVYVASHRVVLPCIVAHFAINVVLEPWLVYAYALRALTKSRATAP